jgi:hypothetical protein
MQTFRKQFCSPYQLLKPMRKKLPSYCEGSGGLTSFTLGWEGLEGIVDFTLFD